MGFDIGGTFTDFAARDPGSGETWYAKVLSTPSRPADAALAGLEQLLAGRGRDLSEVGAILHGTTVAANALIERKGSRTGLITTEGFRDVLLIGRQKRYDTYDLRSPRPRPLIERRAVTEVRERVGADGEVITPLDRRTLDRSIDLLLEQQIESVAVSLLHAYVNPRHERAVRERLLERSPGLTVSLSSEVSPKQREYERTSTTVANAFVRPVMERYMSELDDALRERGFDGDLLVMQSNGGLAAPAVVREHPVRSVESGPAAGVLMCAELSGREDAPDLLTFDMGGTTAKLGAIRAGRPAITRTFEVDPISGRRGAGLPLNIPAIDLLEIGAGGGSIASVSMGTITVGPHSAGADPGPIAYGRGGEGVTVTDANIVLGYINPSYFNGGDLELDPEGARRGVEDQVAKPLGLTLEEAAWGVHAVANANMERALRVVSLERGLDPRSFALVGFGGAGPLHAARLARTLGIPRVYLPRAAGVGSAVGLLGADARIDVSLTRVLALDEAASSDAIAATYAELQALAVEQLGTLGGNGEISFERYAFLRYERQGFELRVDLDEPGNDAARWVEDSFHRAHQEHYGYREDRPVIGVDWCLSAASPVAAGEPNGREADERRPARAKRSRRVYFPERGGYVDCKVVDRNDLQGGVRLRGPALVEEPESTVVVPPGDLVTLTTHGTVLLELQFEGER